MLKYLKLTLVDIIMKTIEQIFYTILLSVCLQLAFTHPISAQKMIKIDEQLKENSQSFTVKRKGIRAIGRYKFGPFKIISGKQGWVKVPSKSPFFGDHTSIKSSSKHSFVFVNKIGDTCIANIRITENIETDDGNWFSRTFLNWSDSEVKKGEGVFETDFSFSRDTVPWRLTVIYPVYAEAQNGDIKRDTITKFRGALTSTNTIIEIKKVTIREDGKKRSWLNPILGYELWQGPKSLAAVQVMPVNRMHVWIRDDLDSSLKFILASSLSALLVHTL